MAIVTSMINWKGGVGKTTITLHIAAGLAHRSKRVLLVDLDPQCNLSFLAVGLDSYVHKVYEDSIPTLKDVFDGYFDRTAVTATDIILGRAVNSAANRIFTRVGIVLSHQELTLLDLKLAREKRPGRDHKEETRLEIEKLSILKELLDQVSDDYDYVLLDCPPNVNLVTQNAFFASDYYLVPAIPDFLSTTGISLIRRFMDQFNSDFQGMWTYAGMPGQYTETKFGGVVFNMVDEYGGGPKAGHAQIMSNVQAAQGPNSVFEHYVTDGDGISAAAEVNIPVFAYNDLPRAHPNAQKQAEYLNGVVDEFLTRIV